MGCTPLRVRTVNVPNASRWLAPAGLKTDNPSFWAPTYVLLADMWRSLMAQRLEAHAVDFETT